MRVLLRVLASVVTVLALIGAVRLVVSATDPSGVRRQLAFLRAELEGGADADAQALFPEGYYFLNVLYGLTWVDLGHRGVEPERAADEAAWALARVESPAGRAPFEAGAVPAYGVFYAGWTVDGSRGTSQALIQRFLVDVDPVFAREQYLRFREEFLARPLGITPAIREYPHGVNGAGDVDSGPLLLGVSLSTTVVALGAARSQGDDPLAEALAGFGEFAGIPFSTPGTKRYALGLVPIGDAFLAWSKTARPWTVETPAAPDPAVSWWWRLPLLTLLFLIGAAPWSPVRRRIGMALWSPVRHTARRLAARRANG
ncbi:hypothetical protein KZ829_15475 [Actinoplanes hulinensis]|uniref:ER-bound oxygenase mpaB/mpaB'/Rubber oxygenase catalytic domain-containing protein n=1 Tax=Actinoplanes hulinensis TaxID=1144547 RepID=A0ABS7B2D7_9ACTN|nr:hypothetical protein [Actinoplanes hulinensis]MBW6435140.1 hypothetical protein [Actinoplanes hulinensis]